jgi:hypothetical protein
VPVSKGVTTREWGQSSTRRASLPPPFRLLRSSAVGFDRIFVQVVARQLWGSDVYSDDSDVVAILAHTGLFPVRQTAPTKLQGVSVFARVSETLVRRCAVCGVAAAPTIFGETQTR